MECAEPHSKVAFLLGEGPVRRPGSAMHSRDDALLPGARVQVLHGPDSAADRSRVMIAPIGQVVGCSQKGYHFGRPVGTTLPESILVGPNALHLMLRAFGPTRMCHGYGTRGTLQIARVVPNQVVTDTRCFGRRQTPSYRYDVVIVQGGPSRDACL